MDDNDNDDDLLELLLLIIFILIEPVIYFCIGYIVGAFTKLIFGSIVVRACAMCGLTVTANQIPYAFGLIGMVSSFFNNFDNSDSKAG